MFASEYMKIVEVYAARLVFDYPLFPNSYVGPAAINRKNNIYLDPEISNAFENAIKNNVRIIKEEKLNKILAESLAENHYAINFIKMWNSKNIRKEWSDYCGFPYFGKEGMYYEQSSASFDDFSNICHRTKFFSSFQEANEYFLCNNYYYNWGHLNDYILIEKIQVEENIVLEHIKMRKKNKKHETEWFSIVNLSSVCGGYVSTLKKLNKQTK